LIWVKSPRDADLAAHDAWRASIPCSTTTHGAAPGIVSWWSRRRRGQPTSMRHTR